MTAMCRFVVLLLGLSACATQEETSARSDAPETASQSTESTAASTLDLVLSEAGLGPARICAPLAEAAAALGPARDSAFLGEAEDDRWPGKIVRLSDGQNVLLEASWADSAHVWRISTTSPQARTRGGVRVGTTAANIPAASGPLKAELPEGQLVVELTGDSVGATLDSASERELMRRWTPDGDWLTIVPQSARIVSISRAGRCQHPDSAA